MVLCPNTLSSTLYTHSVYNAYKPFSNDYSQYCGGANIELY